MVGIVVVSHSAKLAEGVAELAQQMTQNKCALAVAGGIDDPANPIGTDPVQVMTAIETVMDDDGVLVLMDLGSALLSAEMALELLGDEVASSVELCAAPIVEGTMAAAVAAGSGLPLTAVKEEALGALSAKKKHLGVEEEVVVTAAPEAPVGEELRFSWTVLNPHGLHARPAAAIVGALAGFDAVLQIEKAEERANAKSLNAIAGLSVRRDDEITFIARGVQAEQAIAAFKALAEDGFGEDVSAEPVVAEAEPASPPLQSVEGAIAGLPASQGIAFGRVVFFQSVMPAVPDRAFAGVDEESDRLFAAIGSIASEMQRSAKSAKDADQSGIFTAHVAMLTDPELEPKLRGYIADENAIAEQAWISVMFELKAQYEAADSDYMRQRAVDIWDITRQVMVQLTGSEGEGASVPANSILIAEDLTPTDTAKLDKEHVLGICLTGGGKTSHSAIIARAMGIPAIVRAAGAFDLLEDGQQVVLDGFEGLLWTDPSEEMEADLVAQHEAWKAEQAEAASKAMEPAITLDGVHFPVQANIGSFEDAEKAVAAGAEGVGLMRTEFLFQSRAELPDEQSQYEEYKRIAAAFGDHPITIRTLDVGGDKPLESYPVEAEENPFLGHRGVRMCLADRKLFSTQIRALIRAAAEQPNIQMMIPMISTVSELKDCKKLVEEAREELGLSHSNAPMNVGIMIEVPSAVLDADNLAAEADFFSIGTNDLTQYVMAADRGNPKVSELVDYTQPAVLRAIRMTCEAGKRAGIPVSMCGEMAGDTQVTELLLKAGISKLSASASLLPALKEQIRQTSLS
ncbi:Phosphoenolpyruvate-protein phosphotransferase [Pseudovibrio sp. FO-BEG1]|uniref:phosphoenolpyruvate--protein phosphotransferase n=1 Tax=Pseudovibrio sp. (strain FO-BEG1) TaxID=911045 RepID=UPI000238CCEB|nr:phosphoenolpyruvate--protein phosphotransferase [Pseudovibrio sp. FO-BEG1]AEV36863.1 Phosphoenolpyruvate-protein phosphotransferase [Pseudovibrio sp. FO-BEG1]